MDQFSWPTLPASADYRGFEDEDEDEDDDEDEDKGDDDDEEDDGCIA